MRRAHTQIIVQLVGVLLGLCAPMLSPAAHWRTRGLWAAIIVSSALRSRRVGSPTARQHGDRAGRRCTALPAQQTAGRDSRCMRSGKQCLGWAARQRWKQSPPPPLLLPGAAAAAPQLHTTWSRVCRCAVPGGTWHPRSSCGSSSAWTWNPTRTCGGMTCCQVWQRWLRVCRCLGCMVLPILDRRILFGGSRPSFTATPHPVLRALMRRRVWGQPSEVLRLEMADAAAPARTDSGGGEPCG